MKKKNLFALLLIAASLVLGGCTVPDFSPIDDGGQGGDSGKTDDGSDDSGKTDDGGNTNPPDDGSGDDGSADDIPPEQDKFTLKNPDYSSYEIRNSFDELTSDDLFNLHNKVEITVRVSNEELDKIVNDNSLGPKPDIYRYADYMSLSITNNGVKYSEQFVDIGIRQKGNTSREAIFNGNHLNNHNHYKLSFDEKFNDVDIYGQDFVNLHGDKKRGDREILSLSGLDIKWDRNTDNTHIREIYSSLLFRSAGIITQRIGLATFTIVTDTETVPFGLCYIYEQASKSLIKHSLESGDSYIGMGSWSEEKKGTYGVEGAKYGDLYKATYGTGPGANSGGDFTLSSIDNQRVGVRTELYGNNIPAYERKTNKDDPSDEQFKNIVSTLNSGTYADIDKVIDLDYFAVEEAVAFFAGNPDSMRYNYNNYEFYIRRTDGKMVFIPIDGDRDFGIGNTWSDGLRFVMDSNRTPLDKKDVQGNNCRNPLFNKTILASGDNNCKKLFLKFIDKIATSTWVKSEAFEGFYNVAKNTYAGEATFSLSANGDNVTFTNYINTKLVQGGYKAVNDNTQNTSVVNDPDNMYLVGTFNNWGDYPESQLSTYKLNKVDTTSFYTCSITITENNSDEPNNFIKLKINSGRGNYSPNDYTIIEDNNVYKLSPGGSSFRLYGYGIGSSLTVNLDVSTGVVTFSH